MTLPEALVQLKAEAELDYDHFKRGLLSQSEAGVRSKSNSDGQLMAIIWEHARTKAIIDRLIRCVEIQGSVIKELNQQFYFSKSQEERLLEAVQILNGDNKS